MQINSITSAISKGATRIGQTILDNKPDSAKLGNSLRKVNNFIQGESFNPGRGAYYVLMGGCVIAPRLVQAREPDEFREILTRDIITVLTILFAMKGLKSGMCTAAQKKAGIPLVEDLVGKNANKFQRLKGYLNPNGGITALDSNEINSRYSRIFTQDELVKTLEMVDKEGGSIADMFSVETKGSFISKLFKKQKKTPLLDAAKEMLGDDFTTKSNKELIDIVKNITPENEAAMGGMEKIIGSKPFGEEAFCKQLAEEAKVYYDEAVKRITKKQQATAEANAASTVNVLKHVAPAKDSFNKTEQIAKKETEQFKRDKISKLQQGILNGENNPITYYARNIAANFETLSLALTAGFLGFGLPKLNEQLTMKKHLNKPGVNPTKEPVPTNACPVDNPGIIYDTIEKHNKKPFQAFMGKN